MGTIKWYSDLDTCEKAHTPWTKPPAYRIDHFDEGVQTDDIWTVKCSTKQWTQDTPNPWLPPVKWHSFKNDKCFKYSTTSDYVRITCTPAPPAPPAPPHPTPPHPTPPHPTPVPEKTGDISLLWIVLGSLALLILLGYIIYRKYVKKDNKTKEAHTHVITYLKTTIALWMALLISIWIFYILYVEKILIIKI